jgi:hypothetical protein
VANGLGGALCRNGHLAGALSADARRNCRTSGTPATAAPIGDYGFDVHIDTGALGLSARTLQAALQTLVLTPVWTALVWLTHATLSLVEWSPSTCSTRRPWAASRERCRRCETP